MCQDEVDCCVFNWGKDCGEKKNYQFRYFLPYNKYVYKYVLFLFTHRALRSNGEGNWFTRRIGYFNLFGISFWSKIPFVIIISYI